MLENKNNSDKQPWLGVNQVNCSEAASPILPPSDARSSAGKDTLPCILPSTTRNIVRSTTPAANPICVILTLAQHSPGSPPPASCRFCLTARRHRRRRRRRRRRRSSLSLSTAQFFHVAAEPMLVHYILMRCWSSSKRHMPLGVTVALFSRVCAL